MSLLITLAAWPRQRGGSFFEIELTMDLLLLPALSRQITPRLPIHRQYADEANKLGLSVSDDAVRKGFKASESI